MDVEGDDRLLSETKGPNLCVEFSTNHKDFLFRACINLILQCSLIRVNESTARYKVR